jgi:hypothetical protein
VKYYNPIFVTVIKQRVRLMLGHLFRNTVTRTKNRNLAILLEDREGDSSNIELRNVL